MAIKKGTQDNFKKEVLDHKGLVFVDFYAEWCGPCKMTSPIIDKLLENKKYKDILFVKVNVDESGELSSQFNIFSIPTFVIFKNGEPISQFAGARDMDGFESELDKVLSD